MYKSTRKAYNSCYIKEIELFKKNKQPDDTLSRWIDRIVHGNESSEIKSVGSMKKILSPLVIPPSKDEDPDFYSDYGTDTSYHTITGKGECAAWATKYHLQP